MITAIQWAQLAAFIDGEGTIVICKARLHYTQLVIRIANTDPRLPMWCEKVFGGRVYAHSRANELCRDTYTWVTQSKKAEVILRGCLPYFLLKREQAEVALAYRETFRHVKGNTPEQELTVDRQAIRQQYRVELSRLKRELPEEVFVGAPLPTNSKETIQ